MYSGTTVIRNASRMVPDSYITKLLTKNPHTVGLARVGKDCLVVVRAKEGLKLEGFNKIQKMWDKERLVFFAGNGELAKETDLQPFSLLDTPMSDKSIKPILLAYLDGNFDGFIKKGSVESPQYFCVQNYIIPKVKKLHTLLNGDMKKLMEELQSEDFKYDMSKTMIGNRGSITLFSVTGDIISYTVADDATCGQFSWGWTSDAYDYAEQVQHTPDLADQFAAGEPSKSPPVETKPEPASSTDSEEWLTVIIPEHLRPQDMHKKRAKYIEKRVPGGQLMPDWQTITEFKVRKSEAPPAVFKTAPSLIRTFQGLAAALQPNKTDTAVPAPTSVPSVPPPTETPKSPAEPEKAGPPAWLKNKGKEKKVPGWLAAKKHPEQATAETKSGEEVKIALDKHSNKIIDPSQWDYEEKRKTFVQLCGTTGLTSIWDTENWAANNFMQLVKDPKKNEQVLALILDWKAAAIKLKAKMAEALKDDEEDGEAESAAA